MDSRNRIGDSSFDSLRALQPEVVVASERRQKILLFLVIAGIAAGVVVWILAS